MPAHITYLKKERWLFSCLIFLLCCKNNRPEDKQEITDQQNVIVKERANHQQIDSLRPLIKTGDLILRTGNDFTSESLRSLNQRNKTYSHCGIASIENDTIYIYHALGGEWNPDEKICKDEITHFADPKTNRGIGLYRFNLGTEDIKNLIYVANQLRNMGVTFDMSFDLKSNNKMYCAEFVYKTYQLSTHNRLKFRGSNIGKFEFMGVDDIFLHQKCRPVYEIVYKL